MVDVRGTTPTARSFLTTYHAIPILTHTGAQHGQAKRG